MKKQIARYHFKFEDQIDDIIFVNYVGECSYGTLFEGFHNIYETNLLLLVVPLQDYGMDMDEERLNELNKKAPGVPFFLEYTICEKDGLRFLIQMFDIPDNRLYFPRNSPVLTWKKERKTAHAMRDILFRLKTVCQVTGSPTTGLVNPDNILLCGTQDSDEIKAYVIDLFRVPGPGKNALPAVTTEEYPDFIAPECTQGEVNAQTDIYALGVLMKLLFFGSVRRQSDPQEEKECSLLKEVIQMQDEYHVSPELMELFRKSLSPDPSCRFASIQDMLTEMEAFCQKLDEQARKEEQERKEFEAFRERMGKAEEEEEMDQAGKPTLQLRFQRWDESQGGFDEVAGMEQVKESLTDSLFTLNNPDIAKAYRIKPHNGILLYGPPGCGKTYIAEHFARESHLNYACVKASDLANIFAHGTTALIRSLFNKARLNAPCILCLDEIDALITNRRLYSNSPGFTHEVNEFLSQMNDCGEDGVIVIGTTNNPQQIDPAALRSGRMDRIIYIPLPDEKARRALLEYELKERPLNEDIDIEALTTRTAGFASSDISTLVNQVALHCARQRIQIGMSELLEKITSYRPSVSPHDLQEYERLHESFTGRSAGRTLPHIGFTTSMYSEKVS